MEQYKTEKKTMAVLVLLFALMMSVPFLVPHCGWVALLGFVPLLCMDKIATDCGMKRVWVWHYTAFVLWNAATTFWVCNATVGGGIFAILANSLQMSLVFGAFRLSRKVFRGSVPYIFLAAAWIAWERYYLTSAQISWPWLVLGNSFARTLSLAQWYEYTGTLGGSLWIWASNLAVFGLMVSLSDGSFFRWNVKARTAAGAGTIVILIVPAILSLCIWKSYEESSEPLEVGILQPNIDPYQKFQRLTQDQQNAILEGQLTQLLAGRDSSDTSALLVLGPETFTSDVDADEVASSKTWRRFDRVLGGYKGVNMILGASSAEFIRSDSKPSKTARPAGDGWWRESHNSAVIADGTGRSQIFHKSKLVVAVEMTPYPGLFCKIDDMLGGVMGRCIGQDEISLLDVKAGGPGNSMAENQTGGKAGEITIPIGCAICYESIYGEYCTGYVQKGARALAVITNDSWWGNTPGYRQHLSYSSLRAIELRRDIARCGNSGISAFIDQRGRIIDRGPWWEQAVMTGTINLNDKVTFFAQSGDIVGRLCVLVSILQFLAMLVRLFLKR